MGCATILALSIVGYGLPGRSSNKFVYDKSRTTKTPIDEKDNVIVRPSKLTETYGVEVMVCVITSSFIANAIAT